MPSRYTTRERPPLSTRVTCIGSVDPSNQSSAPGAKRSGQSVSCSSRIPPCRPLGPSTRATARRRSLGVGDDVELDVASVPVRHDPEQAADRVRDPAVAADDAPHVLLVHAQGQQRLVAVLLDLDPDRIGLVDEGARDVLEEVLHASAFSPSSVAGSASTSASATTSAGVSSSAAVAASSAAGSGSAG